MSTEDNKPKHPGSENLIPFSQRSEEEQRAMRVKGGKASGRARAEKRAMKDLLNLAFSRQIENKNTGEKKSAKEVTAIKMVDGCIKGDPKMIKLAMEITGEITKNVEVTGKDGKDLFAALSDAELMAQYEEMKRKTE